MKEDTMLETRRPKLDMLSRSFIDQIVSEAVDVLGKTGESRIWVQFHHGLGGKFNAGRGNSARSEKANS
jgi:hypothetical protein